MDSWRRQARDNIREYGDQSVPVLTLATVEEAGELAQALLHHEYENGDPERVTDELRDLAALGYAWFWKATEYPTDLKQHT